MLDVFPKLSVNGRGARLQVQGDIGLGAVHYLNGSLSDRLLPSGNLDIKSTLVDRLLFLDGSLSATSSVNDPFTGRPEGATAFNTLSTVRGQVSPALIYAPSAYTQFEARDRTTLIKSSGDDLAADDSRRRVRRQDDLLRFERKPVPLGLTLEATSEKTTYQVQDLAALSLVTARATATWAPNPELVLGVRTGRDRSSFSLNKFTDPLEGVTLNWKPNDRTELDAVAERRFFGKSGVLSFSHRSPFLNVVATPAARAHRVERLAGSSCGRLGPGGRAGRDPRHAHHQPPRTLARGAGPHHQPRPLAHVDSGAGDLQRVGPVAGKRHADAGGAGGRGTPPRSRCSPARRWRCRTRARPAWR